MHARTLALASATVVGAGAAALGWALTEAHLFRLRTVTVPLLPPGSPPRRVLHISDLHMTPNQRDKQAWVRALARLEPDLVVGTGDFIAHMQAVPHLLDTLAPLGEFPGVFVLGSNDYFEPTNSNPLKYFSGPSPLQKGRRVLPWGDLVSGLMSFGWTDLDNREAELQLDGWTVSAKGVDDPHIGLDRYDEVLEPYDATADLRLGVAHAPYLRVLDAMTADGADLIIAGHTHGGQICVPFVGALVTNCDLPRSMVKGLHEYRSADGGTAHLHVSAGLGTSPHAPIRFGCPPEATLITLLAGA